MKRSIANSKITKDMILSKVSQQLIAATYLDLPVDTIEYCIETGKTISSPLREDDEHPSFGFAINNRGQLKAKDFAGYFWGDVWDIVAYVLSAATNREIDIRDKNDFIFILRHVVYTFRHIIYGQERDERVDGYIKAGLTALKGRKAIIEIVPRPWNSNDKAYWSKFGVSLNFLNTHFVYAVDQYYINRKVNPEPKYFYDVVGYKDVCYAYLLGQDRRGIYNWKLYFPNRGKDDVRFITNCNHLEGVYNLERNDYDYIVITKSSKDRICLDEHLYVHPLQGDLQDRNLLIGVINIPHETHKLTQREYNFLKAKLRDNGKLISLFDNDRTGYMCAINYRDDYDIFPICIPHEYGAKDFAELRTLYSAETINNFILQTIKFIEDGREIEDEGSETSWYSSSSDALPY